MTHPVAIHTLERQQLLPLGPARAFDFFADARNLEAITPPWLRFQVVTPAPIRMRAGTQIEYRLRLHALPLPWFTRIEVWEPGRRFEDVQLRGPYRFWHQAHVFEPHEAGALMRDLVHYALPLGALGRLAGAALVSRDLERIFDFRRDAVAARLGRGQPRRAPTAAQR